MNHTLHYLQGINSLFGGKLSAPGFVLKHGQEFGLRVPHVFRGIIRECYKNAFELIKQDASLIYCEGFATGAVVPVMHAWCVNKDNEVIDPTWKWGQGQDYYGIKFKREFVIPFVDNKESYGVLDDMDNDFPVLTGKIPVEQWKLT